MVIKKAALLSLLWENDFLSKIQSLLHNADQVELLQPRDSNACPTKSLIELKVHASITREI